MKILGVHFGHDSNAALVADGRVVADAAEERFNRVKHSGDPPLLSVRYCLEAGGLSMSDLDVIAVSGQNPHKDFYKLFVSRDNAPPVPAYHERFPVSERTRVKNLDHHLCHAAASYYLSGSREPSLVLISDGFGDDCAVSLWKGDGPDLKPLHRFGDGASLGWFYSNVTEALGWVHGDGEGKTMALASGGNRENARGDLLSFCPQYDGGNPAKTRDFGEVYKLVLRGANQWHLKDADEIKKLLSVHTGPDLAAAAQALIEEQHLGIAEHWMRETGSSRLCLGGGVFLNIVLNRKLADLEACKSVFIYPNPGDSGLGLGAALAALAEDAPHEMPGGMDTVYLGPGYSNQEIKDYLEKRKLNFEFLEEEDLCRAAAGLLAENLCVGWFQGRMETGPRALGNRSILMSARSGENKDYINLNVKFREPFRPFCPTLISEDRSRYVREDDHGPYMILAFDTPEGIRPDIQAVAHVDGSIRPQILEHEANPRYYRLIRAYKELTGQGILLNTSFNVKGEPIVNSPADAVKCFFSTGMDALALGKFLLRK